MQRDVFIPDSGAVQSIARLMGALGGINMVIFRLNSVGAVWDISPARQPVV